LFISNAYAQTYPIVETGVTEYYDDISVISAPTVGQAYYGQDAHYNGNSASYTNNGDGTVSDHITGLMWERDMGNKITYTQAISKANSSNLGGYSDWRIPTIKELFSLVDYSGRVMGENAIDLFIDTTYFIQPLGNTAAGEREIDAQTWTQTHYNSLTFNGDSTLFGMNFIDGRLKGYPKYEPGSNNTIETSFYFRLVRGNSNYGINQFVGNGNGTVTDNATGLTWQKADDGIARDWESALDYAENLNLGGHSDWRLPNAKELQSIVDYTRCPDFTNSPAIDPIFNTTSIFDTDGIAGQYPYFWSSTILKDGPNPNSDAVYVAFGEAHGELNNTLYDTHGAGAVRNDPKSGDSAQYPDFFGPQGDVRYVYNYVRAVRGQSVSGLTTKKLNSFKTGIEVYPNPTSDLCHIDFPDTYSNLSIRVLNLLGMEVLKTSQVSGNSYTLDLNPLKRGIYFIYISDGGMQQSVKIVKQ
jgi:hypothetical protein